MISVIIPAKNEAEPLKQFLPTLRQTYPDFEIIVVNDGSTDDTAHTAMENGAIVVSHPYPMGHGAALKSGVRVAKGDTFIFMDADGQHQVKDIEPLLTKFNEGFDMVVGARDKKSQANTYRWAANSFGNFLASQIVGHSIIDLTSGFRIVKAHKFKEFLYLYPNGFSTPTTVTMAFFRSAYSVCYVPIDVQKRIGVSHLRPFRDAFRFLLIIYKMTTLYSPLKVFLPFAALHFIAGLANYFYTYTTSGRFTNMSAFLFSASIIIFLIGLLCEQITTLTYSKANDENNH